MKEGRSIFVFLNQVEMEVTDPEQGAENVTQLSHGAALLGEHGSVQAQAGR